ncbi:hypothetical protein [Leptothrix ochracea]|uniref:hypothetical protein n=1 Tax=Leptothrix ochracea TaxID=735331 RepID=UPI0034E248EF
MLSARSVILAATLLGGLITSPVSQAALQDEVQVYDDSINEIGEFGVELHINTTPSGSATPNYPGEVVSLHGWRLTPEFSWGWTRTVELGLYVPTVMDAQGSYQFAGLKGRIKWLPIQADTALGGWFAGVNFELAHVKPEYDQAKYSTETKLIGGYRGPHSLISTNLNIGTEMEGPNAGQRPEMSFSIKATRALKNHPAFSPGVELYTDLGRVGQAVVDRDQDRRLFLTLDVERKPWEFSFGIGRGLTPVADTWTLKMITEIPFSL